MKRNPSFNDYKADISRLAREISKYDNYDDYRHSDEFKELEELAEQALHDPDLTHTEQSHIDFLITGPMRWTKVDHFNKQAPRRSEEAVPSSLTYEEWLTRNRHFRNPSFNDYKAEISRLARIAPTEYEDYINSDIFNELQLLRSNVRRDNDLNLSQKLDIQWLIDLIKTYKENRSSNSRLMEVDDSEMKQSYSYDQWLKQNRHFNKNPKNKLRIVGVGIVLIVGVKLISKVGRKW